MHHTDNILHYLGQRLMQLYCPGCSLTHLTKHDFRDHLILAICNRWNIDWSLLPGEETFYHSLHADHCGSAMREKLAIFYYAMTDDECRSKMPRLYLDIAKKQRLEETPHWNRLAEEYNKHHKPRNAKYIDLSDMLHSLETLQQNDLKKVEEKLKRLMKGK